MKLEFSRNIFLFGKISSFMEIRLVTARFFDAYELT
jgi:hypothetical protein